MAPEHFCLLVAVWEFTVGIPLLIRRQRFLLWLDSFVEDTPKVRKLFAVWLAIGALAVKENPYPAWNLSGVLSGLAWLTMIKCALGVLWTRKLGLLSLKMIRTAPPGTGAFVMGIGVSLIYVYFKLHP